MAYQNVGTPIFYVDYLLWRKSLGLDTVYTIVNFPFGDVATIEQTINLNPTNPIGLYSSTVTDIGDTYIQLIAPPAVPSSRLGVDSTRYFAVLGHNIASAVTGTVTPLGVVPPGNNVVNGETPMYDGFSIVKGLDDLIVQDDVEVYRIFLGATETNLEIGCYSVGNYYQMPHSPDLSLTMTREYGGIKTIETKGGASLSNAFYTKPPAWGNLGAWELSDYTTNQKLSRSGRRVWDLSFSYIQDSDIFPEVSNLNALESLSPEGLSYETDLDPTGNTLLDDPNFYSQVIHKTNGQLPFIFQPDNSNFNPDQFAICKFDSGFSFQQTAPNLYSVRMKIREVW